ncbi:MAG: hypothetical protein ACKV2O_22060, partial [Acidimicrobiales bacterium]
MQRSDVRRSDVRRSDVTVTSRRERTGAGGRGRWVTVWVCVAAVVLSLVSVVNRLDAAIGPTFTPLGEPAVGGRVTSISLQPGGTGVALVGGDMLGVARSSNGGASWTPATGLHSYEMADFTWDPLHPNQVWVGSMSGPALSSDGGINFAPMRNGMPALSGYPYSSPVQRVVYLDDNSVLAFGGSQRRWSEENGHPERYGTVWFANRASSTSAWSDWTSRSTLPGNIVTASKVGNTVWAVVRGGTAPGVYRSDNVGASWTRAAAPGGSHEELSDLAVHPTQANTIWVTRAARVNGNTVVPGAVYRSTTGGSSWSGAINPPPTGGGNVDQVTGFEAIEAAASVSGDTPPVLYISDVGQFVKKTYRSTDGGDNWTVILDNAKVSALPAAYSGGGDMFTLAVDPANANSLYAGSQEHLLSYNHTTGNWTDRASTWDTLTQKWKGNGFSGLVSSRVVFGPEGSNKLSLNALDGGNLLQSGDGGGTWTRPLAGGIRFTNGVRNPGNDWMDQWMGAVDTAYSSDGKVYVLKGMFGWFAGVAISTGDGTPFTLNEGTNGLPIGMTFTDRQVTAIETLRPNEVIFTMDGCIWRTTNAGGNWAKESRSCSLGLGDIVKDPNTDGVIYAQGKTAVYRSGDFGKTFSALAGSRRGISPGATAGSKGRLAIAKTGATNGLYATSLDGANKGVYKWTGSAWVNVTPTAPSLAEQERMFDIAVDPTNANRVAVVVLDHP